MSGQFQVKESDLRIWFGTLQYDGKQSDESPSAIAWRHIDSRRGASLCA
jgi:hypothetical protein